MKNRFGFIPIVLPVLVMVLIIGLINLTGPQIAQAQEADVSEEDARLSALTLTYDGGTAGAINVLSPTFMADRGSYTAMVDYDVTAVTLTATGPLGDDGSTPDTNYAVAVSSAGAESATTFANGSATTITAPTDADRETALTITVTGSNAAAGKMATYTVALTHKKAANPDGSPKLTTLTLTSAPPVSDPGSIALMKTDGGVVTVGADNNGLNMFKASVPFRVQSVVVAYTAPAGADVDINQANRPFLGDPTHAQSADADGTYRVRLPVGMTSIRLDVANLGGRADYTIEPVTRELPVLDVISIVDSSSAATARFITLCLFRPTDRLRCPHK